MKVGTVKYNGDNPVGFYLDDHKWWCYASQMAHTDVMALMDVWHQHMAFWSTNS